MPSKHDPVPEDLDNEDKQRLIEWIKPRYPEIYNPRDVRELVDACLAYHRSIGNRNNYVNWYAVCQRWIINDRKWSRELKVKRSYRDVEYPQEPRDTGYESSDLVAIAPIIDMMTGKVRK